MDPRLLKARYILLPGKPTGAFTDLSLHNDVYRFWRRFWSDVLKDVGAESKLEADAFLRHDIVTALIYRGTIIGLHAYSFYDLRQEAAREHSYFNSFIDDHAFQRLSDFGVNTVMTMEYLSVDREWRSSKVGVSIGSILISLGNRIARTTGVEGVLGAARADVATARIAYHLGAIPLGHNIEIHGCPTEMVLWTQSHIRPSTNQTLNDLVDHYWENRHDTVGVTTPENRIAA